MKLSDEALRIDWYCYEMANNAARRAYQLEQGLLRRPPKDQAGQVRKTKQNRRKRAA